MNEKIVGRQLEMRPRQGLEIGDLRRLTLIPGTRIEEAHGVQAAQGRPSWCLPLLASIVVLADASLRSRVCVCVCAGWSIVHHLRSCAAVTVTPFTETACV